MQISRLLIITFLIPLFIYAQELSVHKLHLEEFGSKKKQLAKNENLTTPIIPLQVKSKPDKVIFGYLPDWEYSKGSHQYFNYDLLTHVATFDFMVDKFGNVSYPSGWPWTDLINKSHSNGVKVIMTAVNFDGDDIHSIITNESNKAKFFNRTKSILDTYKLDGVNIDFESLNDVDKGGNIVNFMKELTEYIHTELPGKEVSFAGPAINWGNDWDLKGIADNCDYVFIMGYSFAGAWSSSPGPQAPLTNTGNLISISRTINQEYANVVLSSPHKLILGLPYYGNKWKASGSSEGATAIDYIKSIFYREAVGVFDQKGKNWSTRYKVPWTAWNEGDWYQVWCDDDSSLGLKIDLALSKNLLGIGMWALGYDGASTDLWNMLARKIVPDVEQVPSVPNNFAVKYKDINKLDVLFSESTGQTGYRILFSKNNLSFSDTTYTISSPATITGLSVADPYYIKIEAFNSTYSSGQTEVLSGVSLAKEPSTLIVNGFDRMTNNSRDYIIKYSTLLIKYGYAYESASNEAVFNGIIDLNNYDNVIWILGDESTADDAFNGTEQEIIIEYLENGGNLLVSGSEIGWDLGRTGSSSLEDISFYKNYLKAEYIDDAPNGKSGEYYNLSGIENSIFQNISSIAFDNGSHGTYDVDWPDAIRPIGGATGILKFDDVNVSDGYAGISYSGVFGSGVTNGKLVYITVPLETIYNESNRDEIIKSIFEFFNTPVSVNGDKEPFITDFKLKQNYPNPFNPATVIEYSIPNVKHKTLVKLIIFDILGNKIATVVDSYQSSGNYKVNWNAGHLASGVYVYQLRAGSFFESRKMILQK